MEEEDDKVSEKLKPTDVEFFKRVLLGESTTEKFRRTFSCEQSSGPPGQWNNRVISPSK